MARKKIIFVIVEGPSDEEALGVILNRFYDQNAVHVHIMRKDITSEKGVRPSNIFFRKLEMRFASMQDRITLKRSIFRRLYIL